VESRIATLFKADDGSGAEVKNEELRPDHAQTRDRRPSSSSLFSSRGSSLSRRLSRNGKKTTGDASNPPRARRNSLPPIVPAMPAIFSTKAEFIRQNPSYLETSILDETRRADFPTLDETRLVYLDYTGTRLKHCIASDLTYTIRRKPATTNHLSIITRRSWLVILTETCTSKSQHRLYRRNTTWQRGLRFRSSWVRTRDMMSYGL
jgi:hypothetical protein